MQTVTPAGGTPTQITNLNFSPSPFFGLSNQLQISFSSDYSANSQGFLALVTIGN